MAFAYKQKAKNKKADSSAEKPSCRHTKTRKTRKNSGTGSVENQLTAKQVECNVRKQDEKCLKKDRDHLNELVQIKTAELSTANEKLRLEITERKRTEKVLQELNKKLMAGKKELHAVNMQLTAHEQQLQAANEQFKASNYELMDSERALRQSEKKYRQLVETMNEGLIVGDKKGCFTFVNDRLCEMLGYSRDEFMGQQGSKFMDEENKKTMLQQLAKRKKGIKNTYEITLTHKNGKKVFVIISPKPLFDETGSYQGSLAVVTDITKLKLAEKEIRASRDFLENVFRTTTEGIVVTDSRGYVLRVNKAVENLLGYTEADLMGKHTAELAAQENRDMDLSLGMITTLREKGYVENFETIWEKKDGELIPVEFNVSLLKDSHGNTTGSVSIIRNIKERKKAEKELKETKDFLESVIESSVDGILICDEMGNIISFNSALEKMCMFTKEELVGRHASELVLKEETVKTYFIEKAAELFEKGFTSYEAKYRNKEGKIIDVECISSMIKDEEGNYVAGVSVIRDVSDRKKMEHQLLQSEKLRSLGELAGGVAHDFNNVLAAILGRAQLMRKLLDFQEEGRERRKSVNEIKKDLETIEKAAIDGAETVRRIQEFSRKREDDKYIGITDLKNVIEGAVEFTKVRWKNDAEAKGIKYRVTTEISSLSYIKGSTSELREVFINLINNALDAMPGGGDLDITAYVDEPHVVVKVRDTGIGITQAAIDRIFDPFFTTKGLKSTGLGMSVSYGIINRHKGTISVGSTEGKGTTFTIRLPLGEKRKKRESSQPAVETSKKVSILIAEDEKGVRELLRDLLICE